MTAVVSQTEARAPTREEHLEILAEAFETPEAFCGLLKLYDEEGVERPFVLRHIQREYLRNRTQRDIVLKARRVSMTTILIALDLYHFLTRPGAQVVVMCHSDSKNEGVNIISAMVAKFIRSLREIGVELPFTTETSTRWEMSSLGSSFRIIGSGASAASAGKKGRAGRITRLHVSEVAMFEFADATMEAILPCVPGLSAGSEIVFESTPKGAGGYFYEKWNKAQSGVDGYATHFYPWWMNENYQTALSPGEVIRPATELEKKLAPEQIKWHRQTVAEFGASKTAQEYPSDSVSCFLFSGFCYFDLEKLDRDAQDCVAAPLRPPDWKGELQIWKDVEPNARYVIGVDVAEGTGGDYTAAVVYKRITGEHVATLHGQIRPWFLAHRLNVLGRHYNNALLVVERNFRGTLEPLLAAKVAVQGTVAGLGYPNVYHHVDGKPGWPTTEVTRNAMLEALEACHRSSVWLTRDARIIREMRTFVVNKRGKPEAELGQHDDLVMAAAVGWTQMTRHHPRTAYSWGEVSQA